MEEMRVNCSQCGCILDAFDAIYFDDRVFCGDCLEEETTLCHECGTRIYRSEAFGDDESRPLCERCYDDYYVNCYECGRLILRENGYYDEDDRIVCNHCINEGPIYSYSYKPEPIFYGEDSTLFLGVELELDDGGTSRSNARELTEIANAEGKYIYIKNDGSLDNGFEIVTHPMTLQFHREKMPWKALMTAALQIGYLSHKAGTCGLHCHVNRSFFGKTWEEQEINIGKVLFLVEKYWDELLRFSRRTQGQMDRWAARYGFKERPHQVMDQAKKAGLGRYACVNLANRNTIEFRMWRGTLKYNTLIATLQMVEKICKAAIFASEEELQELSWWRFVSGITEPELITYLKERRLYINEPVEMEEEE